MRSRSSIINVPLLAGLILSIALHVAALYSKGIYTPPTPRFEKGRTVVHLTLTPSTARPAAEQSPLPVPAAVPIPQEATSVPVNPSDQNPSAASVEQDGSLQEDKGVITEATVSTSIEPSYPRISRLRGEEGVVTLSIQVLSSGQSGNIEVLQSSGYRRLDQAACKAAQHATFSPARQFGRNIDSTAELSFTFRLTDD